MPHTYLISGLRTRSALELPEFEPQHGTLPETDIRIELGEAPRDRARGAWVEGLFQVEPERVLFQVEGVAGYLIERGQRIVVEPAPESSHEDVRLFLLSAAWNVACLQRGLLPLHASAILTTTGLVAFAGRSGAGKSTLAAALAKRGYWTITDDVLIVRPNPGGPAVASPHIQRYRLWRECRLALGLLSAGDAGRDPIKDVVLPAVRVPEMTAPLGRVYLLVEAEAGEPVRFDRLNGTDAAVSLFESTCGFAMLGPMSRRREHFDICVSILRHSEIFTFRRRKAFAEMSNTLEALEAHLRSDGVGY